MNAFALHLAQPRPCMRYPHEPWLYSFLPLTQRVPVPCFSQYPDNAVIRYHLPVQSVQENLPPRIHPVPELDFSLHILITVSVIVAVMTGSGVPGTK